MSNRGRETCSRAPDQKVTRGHAERTIHSISAGDQRTKSNVYLLYDVIDDWCGVCPVNGVFVDFLGPYVREAGGGVMRGDPDAHQAFSPPPSSTKASPTSRSKHICVSVWLGQATRCRFATLGIR